MPTTVKLLVEKVNLQPDKIQKVKWNTSITSKKEGVYIVSTSDSAETKECIEECPISMDILKGWIKKLSGFELDGELTFDANAISKRLSQFWLPDENILYIGKAPLRKGGKGGIGNRVQEYYETPAGDRSPHAGGHWIKALEKLDEFNVYYVECNNSASIEAKMLEEFAKGVSERSKEQLPDKETILPFANLEDGNKKRKKHGLGHMKLRKQGL